MPGDPFEPRGVRTVRRVVTSPVAVPLLLLAFLAVTGCREQVVEEPAVDPVVARLLEESVTASGWHEIGGKLAGPPAALALIDRGAAAVPTLLAMLQKSDEQARYKLLALLWRIGDPRAREPIERLLREGPVDAAGEALEALACLRQPESIPLVRGLLASQDSRGLSRADLLGALVDLGDESAIGELIALAMADPAAELEACQALLGVEGMRGALGLPREAPASRWSRESVLNGVLLVKAAQEWWLDKNGQPSPWRRDPAFRFREPYAAEKEAALASVIENANVSDGGSRVLPVDVDAQPIGPEPVVVQYGWGHGAGIVLVVIEPNAGGARLHRFVGFEDGWGRRRKSTAVSRYTSAQLDATALGRLFAGMRTALAARVEPWWSASEDGFVWTSEDYVVTLCGVDAAACTIGFSGNYGSEEIALQARVRVARDCWIHCEKAVVWQVAELDEAAREALAAAWLRTAARRGDSDWWVRQRMAYVAADLGVRALAVPLLELVTRVDEDLGDRELDWRSLVRLTGVDFRRSKGFARCDFEIARDYRALLGR